MTTVTHCIICGSPERQLWPPGRHMPVLSLRHHGNMMELRMCEICKALWVWLPYEPFDGFPYLVLWNLTENDWGFLYKVDKGKSLFLWHGIMIRRLISTLSEEDIKFVEQHRHRCGGKAPFEETIYDVQVDLDQLLGKSQ